MRLLESWGLPIGNGVVLGLSLLNPDNILKVGQIALIFATTAYTSAQAARLWLAIRRERRLRGLVEGAVAVCDKASRGACPMAEKLDQLEAEK